MNFVNFVAIQFFPTRSTGTRIRIKSLERKIERQSSEHVRSAIIVVEMLYYILWRVNPFAYLSTDRRRSRSRTATSSYNKMLLLQLIGAAALCWLIIIIPAHGAFNDSRPVISTTSNDSRNPRQRISFASEPYYTNFNPFRPYWFNNRPPPYVGKRVIH